MYTQDVPVTNPVSYYNSSMDLCPHCSRMTDILCGSSELTNLHLSTSCSSESLDCLWMLRTLQHLIQALSDSTSSCSSSSTSFSSSSVESFSVNNLSSTAMHNLLMLLEQNMTMLHTSTLESFIANVEQSPFVMKDEWCRFLIGRLKRHIGPPLQPVPLIDFVQPEDAPMESGSETASLPLEEVIIVSDSPLLGKEGMEIKDAEEEETVHDEGQAVGLVLSQQGVAEVAISCNVSLALPQELLEAYPASPSLSTSEARPGELSA